MEEEETCSCESELEIMKMMIGQLIGTVQQLDNKINQLLPNNLAPLILCCFLQKQDLSPREASIPAQQPGGVHN